MDYSALIFVSAGYLIGAIPFGYLVARGKGVDIFAQGSGNIGATNVGRVLGRRFGILVFCLDFAKGAVPVALARSFAWESAAVDWVEVATGAAAFIGHLFPIYLGFRGGKGVATGAGVVAVLVPLPTLAAVLTWLVVAAASRYVSLASIMTVIVLCLVQLLLHPRLDATAIFCLLGSALVIFRHRSNLKRLWLGSENQLGESLMQPLCRSLHVLALGLWFGSAIFFSFIVGLSLFGTMEALGKEVERPLWFPRTEAFAKVDSAIDGPREQGQRVAGFAVGPMFTPYFLIQGICGLVALTTAMSWAKANRLGRWRVGLLMPALLLVLAGWPIEHYVSDLRLPRNQATEVYLQASPEDAARYLEPMREARGQFARWHMVSLFMNLGVIVLITGAMALAGHLPASGKESSC